MDERNYWTSKLISRRAALRGAGLGIAGLAGAALVGCGDDDDEGEEAPAARATAAASPTTAAAAATEAAPKDAAKPGGVLSTVSNSPSPHWSQWHTRSGILYAASTGYFDTLWNFREINDPERLVQPQLAESIEQPDDTTIIMKMREAHFHDQPASKSNSIVNARMLTAEDTAARYEYQKQKGVDGSTFIKESLTVSAVDEHTVKFEMPNPYAFFYEFRLGARAYAYEIPREMLDDTTLKEHIPIGTGPHMYESHRQNSSEDLVRNPNYWLKDRPYLDGRRFTVIKDPAAREAAFRSGEIDHVSFADVKQADAVEKDLGDLIVRRTYPNGSWNSVHVNIHKKPWSDIRVREAVVRAIDVEKIVNVVYFGDGHRTWVSPKAVSGRFGRGVDPVREWVDYDPQKSVQLLQAAEADGAFDPAEEFNFMVPAQVQDWVDSGRLMSDDLNKVGIKSTPETVTYTIYLQRGGPKPGDFDIMMSVYTDINMFKTETGFYWSNTSLEDPEVDALIDKITTTMDAEARKELLQEMEVMLARKYSPVMPMVTRNNHVGHYAYVKGLDYELGPSGFTGWQIDMWKDTA